MMIPIDITAVDPTFTAFVPEPERQLVQNLRADEAMLSESEAKLRGLGRGRNLAVRRWAAAPVIGTLPDALMGGYEVLVTRDTGRRIGVAQDRYVLFHIRPNADVTADQLVTRSASCCRRTRPTRRSRCAHPVRPRSCAPTTDNSHPWC